MGNCGSTEQDILYEKQNEEYKQPEKQQKQLLQRQNSKDSQLPNNQNDSQSIQNQSQKSSKVNSIHKPENNEQPPEIKFIKQKENLHQKQQEEADQLIKSHTFQNLPPEQQEIEIQNLEKQHEIEMEKLIEEQQAGYYSEQIKQQENDLLTIQNNLDTENNNTNHQQSKNFLDSEQNHLKTMVSDIQETYAEDQLQTFYIITCIFSPFLNKQKIEIYRKFQQQMAENGLKLITVEFTTQGSPFIVTEQFYEPYHIQIKVQEPMYLKYNLINTILGKIPNDWGWIGVIDYNVFFNDFDWIENCKRQLQTNVVMQLYEKCKTVSSDPENNNNKVDQSKDIVSLKECLSKHIKEMESNQLDLPEIVENFEAGKAIAFRRDFVQVFGMQDFFITGFEEYYLLLCLEGSCSHIVRNSFKDDVVDFIKKYETDFKEQQMSYGYISNNEIECIEIIQSNYSVQEAVELMSIVSENLEKNKQGLFITNNPDIKNKNSEFRKSLL